MAQHDYVIDNASGATVRADINSALSAIQTLNSGTSAPSSTAAGMLWLDTAGGAPYALKVRDAGNNHWLTLASVTDPGSDGNIETSATIKGTIDSSASFPSGHPLQLKSTTKTDTASNSGHSTDVLYDITGMSVTITPKTTTSKFFVTFDLMLGLNATDSIMIQLCRGTTNIAQGDANGGFQATAESIRSISDQQYSLINVSNSFLDDPTLSDLSAITYKLRWANTYSSNTTYLNRSYARPAESDRGDVVSTISVMEIAG